VEIAIEILCLAATVLVVSAGCRRVGLPAPLVLVVVGIGGSYLPFVPTIELTPELVLLGFLPPLLYAAAIRSSLIDIKANIRTISLLAVGLVLFTMAGLSDLSDGSGIHVLKFVTDHEPSRWLNRLIAIGEGSIDPMREALSMRYYSCVVDYRPQIPGDDWAAP